MYCLSVYDDDQTFWGGNRGPLLLRTDIYGGPKGETYPAYIGTAVGDESAAILSEQEFGWYKCAIKHLLLERINEICK